MITKKEYDLAYEKGEPLISDKEYDKKFGINATGAILDDESPWEKFTHKIPMASLKKVDTIDEDNNPFFTNLMKWVELNDLQGELFLASFKYDGMAIVLYYEDGNFVNAVTRGDGKVGEDISRNVRKMKNFKAVINNKKVTSITSEALITRSTYKEHLAHNYKNIRNAGAGIAKRFKGKSECKHLSLRYYGIEVKGKKLSTEFDKFNLLKELGFKNIAFQQLKDEQAVITYYNKLNNEKKMKNFEADGMVLTVNSTVVQNLMGRDPSGNPKYSIAMKYPYPSGTTTLKSIEWSMGKTGTITPIAKVQAIDLGVTVTNISLANLDTIKKKWGKYTPRVGDTVEVFRSGDVIPQIRKVIKRSTTGNKLFAPIKCPTCKSKTFTDGPFLVCGNSNCDSRKIGDLCKWSDKIKGHFKVKGLGPERINQMFELKLISTIDDLYTLNLPDIIGVIPKVKEKSAKNILAFQKHTEIPLSLFLGGLNIPGIGESIFKFIIEAGYNTLTKVMNMTQEEITLVDGCGEGRAKIIVEWLEEKEMLIHKLLEHLTIVKEKKQKLSSDKFEGKSFCFTGKLTNSRPNFEKLVKENGGSISSVSKKLSYLVAGDKAGSKLAKAQGLNKYITILTEEQFMGML